MSCTRCGGLIVYEAFTDLREEVSRSRFQGHRCLNCGCIEDPVIRANRLLPLPLTRARSTGVVGQGRRFPASPSARQPESLFGNEP